MTGKSNVKGVGSLRSTVLFPMRFKDYVLLSFYMRVMVFFCIKCFKKTEIGVDSLVLGVY